MRAKYQILVFPYSLAKDGYYKYALFEREDLGIWQGIAGGGENGETPLESAKRETSEEASIPLDADYIELKSVGAIPADSISAFKGLGLGDIHEYSFGVKAPSLELVIGHEHTKYGWFTYKEASAKLKWDSNKKALAELNERLV